MDELFSVFLGLWINTVASLVHDITHQILGGVNSQEILTTGGGLFFCTMKRECMVCYRSSIIPLLQNLNRFLVSHLGQWLDLAHPQIWICSVAAWGAGPPLWCMCFILSNKLRTTFYFFIISIRDNVRVKHIFKLIQFRKVRTMYMNIGEKGVEFSL